MENLYVLTENDRNSLVKNKIILGIYTYESGMTQLKLKQQINIEKEFNLEGPFRVIGNSLLIVQPDIKPKIYPIFPKIDPIFPDFFNN